MDSYGGGFMQSQGNDGSPGKSANKNEKGLHPVTIKMMMGASEIDGDNSLKIDGRDASQVTFIGQIISMAEQSTNVHYKIDDGTGAIDVKQWTSDEEPEHSSAVRQSLQEGKYVRVVGQLRSFNGDRNVTGFNIRPVTDMNEITYHLLDVCTTHLYNTRGPPAEGVSRPVQQKQAYGAPNTSSAAPFQAPAASIPTGGSLNDRVLAAFTDMQSSSMQGINVNDVAARLNVSVFDIKKSVETLSMDGHLYSTVDEDHYQTTG